MIRFCYSLAIILLLIACPAFAQVAGSGTSFVVTIPAGATANTYTIPMPRLLMTSELGASVRIQYGPGGRTEDLSIAPGGFDETTLDSASVMLPSEEGTFLNTLLITSDNPITVALLLDRSFASEGFAALPDTLLGLEYFAVSSNENEYGSTITIVGVHDSTKVTITPSAATKGGNPRGVPFTVELNRGEVYQALTDPFVDVDFTGTSIVSNKPCGVLSGSICADLNVGFEHRCNPLIEQLPPTDSWGREFVVGPLERASLTPFRVVARCSNTSVKINGREIAVLNRGEFYHMLLDTIYRVSTSEPAMIAAMVASTSRGLQDRSEAFGDPSMMIAPPRDQWARGYSVVIPSMIARQDAGGPVGWRHFFQIAFIDSTRSGITVDGARPAFKRVMRDSIFTIATVEIGPGPHTVKSAVPIGVLTYGYSVSDAYGYNPGSIDHRYLLTTPDITETVCAGAFDTTIDVTNVGTAPVTVERAEFEPGLDGMVTDPPFPFTLLPGQTHKVRLHIGGLVSGQGRGVFYLVGGTCATRYLAAWVDISGRTAELTPPAGTLIDFGTLPSTIFTTDRTFRIANRTLAPMTLNAPAITPAEYAIVSPRFPLELQPGQSEDVVIRFAPTSEGRFNGRLALHIAGCPDSLIMPLVGVRRRGSYLAVVQPIPYAYDCREKRPRSFPFKVVNRGDLPLNIIDAVMVGAPEFTLTTPLRGELISPGDTLSGEALFTPGPFGTRIAMVQLTTNAINDGTIEIAFEARNDTALLRPSVSAIDLGTSSSCETAGRFSFKVYNDGTLSLSRLRGTLLHGTSATMEVDRADTELILLGDSLVVTLTIDPSVVGAIEDTLRINAFPCGVLSIPIRGNRLRASLAADRDTIDFGVMPGCDSLRDLTLVLRNDGVVNDTIALAHLPPSMLEANPSDFARIILPGDSAVIPLRYRPTGPGSLLDSIDLLWAPCGLRKRVIVKGTFDPTVPTFAPATIDFGATVRGAVVRRSVWLVNRSQVGYAIGSEIVVGAMRLTRASADSFIEPGDSVLFEIEYAPDAIDDTLRGALRIPLLAPCRDTLLLEVNGYSVEERTRFTLRWIDDSAFVGAVAPLRLHVEQTGEPIVDDTLELHTTLHLDGSILVPIEVVAVAPGMTASIIDNRIAGGVRELTLQVRGLFPSSGAIAEVRARVALGGADSTLLTFDTLRLERVITGSPLPLLDTIDGTFRVLGLCRVGTTRLIGTAGFFRLGASRPNPVSDRATIELETNEDAWLRLSLHDISGREHATLLDDRFAPGIYQLALDTRALPSGIYILTLQSPSQMVRREMVVVR